MLRLRNSILHNLKSNPRHLYLVNLLERLKKEKTFYNIYSKKNNSFQENLPFQETWNLLVNFRIVLTCTIHHWSPLQLSKTSNDTWNFFINDVLFNISCRIAIQVTFWVQRSRGTDAGRIIPVYPDHVTAPQRYSPSSTQQKPFFYLRLLDVLCLAVKAWSHEICKPVRILRVSLVSLLGSL